MRPKQKKHRKKLYEDVKQPKRPKKRQKRQIVIRDLLDEDYDLEWMD